jgi:4-hydroxymandelate oxidase
VESLNLHELEALAKRRLPKAVWDYYAGGAGDEDTVAENRAAFARVRLRPRALVDVHAVRTATTVLGTPIALPVLLAPVAYQRLAHPDGEVATARAAASAGTIMVVSTLANTRLEEVAAAAPAGARWFQLYVYKDRAVSANLVARAAAAGYRALVLTVDTPRLGRRERDVQSGFGLPAHLGLANFAGALANQPGHAPGTSGIAHYAAQNLDDSLTWDALTWLRSLSPLPIVVKGVVTGEDAALAVAHGASAIVVSNHGGRQLGGAVATLDALPEVVAAVAGRAEVLVDGGVRRGVDVIKALSLGAKAVLVGRPILHGLAAGGQAGVEHMLRLLAAELDLDLAICGVASVDAVGASLVSAPGRGPAPRP